MLYRKAIDAISGVNAAFILARIGSAYAGYMVRLVVEQTGGTLAGFSVAVYETYAAARAAAGSGVNFNPTPQDATPPPAAAGPTRFRVGPILTAAADASVASQQYQANTGFSTPESANAADRPTHLYLLITPTGGAAGKTFSALLLTASEA